MNRQAFLNLAYTLMYADHEVKDDERERFQLYQTEVEADITQAEVVDFCSRTCEIPESRPAEKEDAPL